MLESISCESALACTTVGFYNPGPFTDRSLAEGHVGVKVPSVSTEFASGISGTSATLGGVVNPNGDNTTYQFEYGTTTSYGTAVPIPAKALGHGTEPLKLTIPITGLSERTTYHFRVTAQNSMGASQGKDEILKTAGVPENLSLPVASPAIPGQAILESATDGTWSESPTSYTYRWKRCNPSGGECLNIVGATQPTYTPILTDVGNTLLIAVTATNSAGSTTASSNPTGKVRAIGQISEYSLPSGSAPSDIATGPDGALWFTDGASGSAAHIGRITTLGATTEYSVSGTWLTGIAAGPDSRLWFAAAGNNKIGAMTTSGSTVEYKVTSGNVHDIVEGPDGRLWFTTTSGKIGAITTAGAVTEYAVSAGGFLSEITVGPDGNLWFTDRGCTESTQCRIGKITTSGVITMYSLPLKVDPWGITSGPDGNLWFTASGSVGKITTAGAITEYSLAGSEEDARGIATGADGNLWFTLTGSNKIGRILPSGAGLLTYSLPAGSEPTEIASGPDKMLWFTNEGTDKIGMITP
jgi:streptogramin lyase